MSDAYIAITLVLVGVVLVVLFLRYKANTSESRMIKMMHQLGLDPEIVMQGDSESIIREVRRRCRRCQSEGLCEQWLAGEIGKDSYFCPNKSVFEELKRVSRA